MSLRVPYLIMAEKEEGSSRLLPPGFWLYPEFSSLTKVRAYEKAEGHVILGSGYFQMPRRGPKGAKGASLKEAFSILVHQLRHDHITEIGELTWVLCMWLDQALKHGRAVERKSKDLKIARILPPIPSRKRR